jgi:hypothetical protein
VTGETAHTVAFYGTRMYRWWARESVALAQR